MAVQPVAQISPLAKNPISGKSPSASRISPARLRVAKQRGAAGDAATRAGARRPGSRFFSCAACGGDRRGRCRDRGGRKGSGRPPRPRRRSRSSPARVDRHQVAHEIIAGIGAGHRRPQDNPAEAARVARQLGAYIVPEGRPAPDGRRSSSRHCRAPRRCGAPGRSV